MKRPTYLNFNFFLAFLIVASFIFRLLYLNDGIFHFDEVSLVEAVEDTYTTGKLHPMVNWRYGAVAINYIVFAAMRLFAPVSAEWTVRFTSALFSTLGVLVLVLLARRLFRNDYMALGSGLLLSVTPVYLSSSTFGKEHTISTFCILLAFYLLMVYHEKK